MSKSATHWAFGLRPHRSETFKVPTPPGFVDKVHDVVAALLACGLCAFHLMGG